MIGFDVGNEGGQKTDSLDEMEFFQEREKTVPTVCFGGRLEWPTGDFTVKFLYGNWESDHRVE